MSRVSAAEAARTAQRIAQSALHLFAEHGFPGVSVDDVAQASNVTRGAVYHHYGNKRGLFVAVAAQLQAEVAEHLVAAADTQEVPAERVRVGCHAFVDAITTGVAARILLIDAPAVIGWQQWRELDTENSVVLLREALAELNTEPDLLDALTAQLSGAMNEGALWVAQQPDRALALSRAQKALDRLLDAALPA